MLSCRPWADRLRRVPCPGPKAAAQTYPRDTGSCRNRMSTARVPNVPESFAGPSTGRFLDQLAATAPTAEKWSPDRLMRSARRRAPAFGGDGRCQTAPRSADGTLHGPARRPSADPPAMRLQRCPSVVSEQAYREGFVQTRRSGSAIRHARRRACRAGRDLHLAVTGRLDSGTPCAVIGADQNKFRAWSDLAFFQRHEDICTRQVPQGFLPRAVPAQVLNRGHQRSDVDRRIFFGPWLPVHPVAAHLGLSTYTRRACPMNPYLFCGHFHLRRSASLSTADEDRCGPEMAIHPANTSDEEFDFVSHQSPGS